MTTKSQVLSYNKSLKLRDLGFSQTGYFWWFQTGNKIVPRELRPWFKMGYKRSWSKNISEDHIVAPTASQLLEKLPEAIHFREYDKVTGYDGYYTLKGELCVWKDKKDYVAGYVNRRRSLVECRNKNLVEALGDLLIKIALEGHKTVENKPII